MKTGKFWSDATERAIKTFAQAAVAVLALSAGLIDVSWLAAFSTAGLAGLISFLTSIGSATVGDHESASLVVATKEKVSTIEP